jgi:hypothetical protein
MAILVVRETYFRNEALVSRDQAVEDALIHQLSGSFQPRRLQIGTFCQKAAHPLAMNPLCPFGAKQIRRCELNEQVSQRRGIEHAGIVDDGEPGH